MAFHAIKAGEGDQYIAAGVEAVSRFPAQAPFDPHPQLDGSEGAPYNVYIPMGLTAENVAERCKVSREAQDEWAKTSQDRAVAARDSGHFDAEIVPVDADGTEVTRDDGPRPGTTLEKLAELKPVFDPENGTVTAGNSCPLNDGAAAVLVMSEEKAKALGLKPRARIVASSVAAIRPEIMGLGPIPAVKAVLEQAGMTIDDIDIVELNEAFAAQVVPCREELGIDPEKLNPYGGAIALGHPFGMTGARIMTTLLNGLDAARRHVRAGDDVRRRRHGPGDDRGEDMTRSPTSRARTGEARCTSLFVCMGNICRSPTAEGVMRPCCARTRASRQIEIDSAGTGGWHAGEPPDERATVAAQRARHHARGRRAAGQGVGLRGTSTCSSRWTAATSRDLLDAGAGRGGAREGPAAGRSTRRGDLDVPDPYYGGDRGFETVLDMVEAACRELLDELRERV